MTVSKGGKRQQSAWPVYLRRQTQAGTEEASRGGAVGGVRGHSKRLKIHLGHRVKSWSTG